MTAPPVDSNIINLMQSLKPFMGSKALRLTEAAEAILDVIASENGLKAQQAIKALRLGKQQVMPEDEQEEAGKDE